VGGEEAVDARSLHSASATATCPKTLIGPRPQRLSREALRAASRSGAVIGSALIYSRVMQEGAAKGAFGTDRRGRPVPWGRIPARVWLGVSAADETAIVEIADEYVDRALGGAGSRT